MNGLPGFFPGADPDGAPPGRQTKSAYNPRHLLENLAEAKDPEGFCPFCNMDPSYTTDTGIRPYIMLRQYCDQLIAEDRLAPHDFIQIVGDFYTKHIRPNLIKMKVVLGPRDPDGEVLVTYPKWAYIDVLKHFQQAERCQWLIDRIRALQMGAWEQQLADHSSYDEGAPDLNNIKVFLLLVDAQTKLAGRKTGESPRYKPY